MFCPINEKIPIVQFDTTFRPSLTLNLLMANSLLADVSYNTPEKMVAGKYKITLLVLKILHSFKCSLVNEKYIESFYFFKKNKA